jgi:mRNA interferase RelE/StbE
MSCYKVIFHKEVKKYMIDNKKIGIKIHKIFTELVYDMRNAEKYDIKKMKGYKDNRFRLRIGNNRVLFKIENDVLIIFVFKVGPRGDVYK